MWLYGGRQPSALNYCYAKAWRHLPLHNTSWYLQPINDTKRTSGEDIPLFLERRKTQPPKSIQKKFLSLLDHMPRDMCIHTHTRMHTHIHIDTRKHAAAAAKGKTKSPFPCSFSNKAFPGQLLCSLPGAPSSSEPRVGPLLSSHVYTVVIQITGVRLSPQLESYLLAN